MSKFILFSLLWWLTGSPFVAIIVLVLVLYFLDRRFIGLSPSLTRPFRLNQRIRKLKQSLSVNPHHTSEKMELAHLLMEKRRYNEALPYLQSAQEKMQDVPEVLYELGLCHLKLGDQDQGERQILQALEQNPKVRYGEPYLRLAEAFSRKDADKALHYLEQFQKVQSSSCEAFYRLGRLYRQLGRRAEARRAFAEAVEIYRTLPGYKRRTERRWALLSWLGSLF